MPKENEDLLEVERNLKALADQVDALVAKAKADDEDEDEMDEEVEKDKSKSRERVRLKADEERGADKTKNDEALAGVKKSLEQITGVVVKLGEQFKAAKAENDVLKAKEGMDKDEKDYFESLEDEKKKSEFLAADKSKRAEIVKVAKAGDEVLTYEGRTISKKAIGADQFEVFKSLIAKSADADKKLAKADDATLTAAITKRVNDEFSHVAGTVEERVAFLKALEGQPEAVKKAGEIIMTNAEKVAKAAFATVGTQRGAGVSKDVAKALESFEGKVSEIQKRDSSTKTEAMSKARAAHPDLYAAAYPENVEAAAN